MADGGRTIEPGWLRRRVRAPGPPLPRDRRRVSHRRGRPPPPVATPPAGAEPVAAAELPGATEPPRHRRRARAVLFAAPPSERLCCRHCWRVACAGGTDPPRLVRHDTRSWWGVTRYGLRTSVTRHARGSGSGVTNYGLVRPGRAVAWRVSRATAAGRLVEPQQSRPGGSSNPNSRGRAARVTPTLAGGRLVEPQHSRPSGSWNPNRLPPSPPRSGFIIECVR